MRRALNLLRHRHGARFEAFQSGLREAGFQVVDRLAKPQPGDVAVMWNRYGGVDEQAWHFARNGADVLVVENNPLGNDWRGGHWCSLARTHVAMTGGEIRNGGAQRWDDWGIELPPFRTGGSETVILAQRGIGHSDVASPNNWAESVRKRISCGRIRAHPGMNKATPLAEDLKNAKQVITWSSAAAVQALAMGVPVWNAHPDFVMASASQPLSDWPCQPNRSEELRLDAFRRLAWAMWELDEIKSGEAIRWLT